MSTASNVSVIGEGNCLDDSSVGIFKTTWLNHKQNAKYAVHILDERRSVYVRHA